MTGFAAPLVLALAVTTAAPLPRMTHAEGDVAADLSGVRTAGGRAEMVLPGGAIVHLDTATGVRWAGGLQLVDGRVIVRTSDRPMEIETPLAVLRLQPWAICTVLVDAASSRLLANVAAGELTLHTRYAHTTRVVAGQSALMTSATGVPWAAAFTRAEIDSFAIWSDARMAATGQAAYGAGEWAASGLSGAYVGPSSSCTGWPSWTAPCWVLPPPPHKPSGPGLPPPSYAPNYAPHYAPNFNVGPPSGPVPGVKGPRSQRPPEATPTPVPPPPPPNPPPSQGRPAARERPVAPGAAAQRPPSP